MGTGNFRAGFATAVRFVAVRFSKPNLGGDDAYGVSMLGVPAGRGLRAVKIAGPIPVLDRRHHRIEPGRIAGRRNNRAAGSYPRIAAVLGGCR
jgi:hypothetical protein